MFTPAAVMALCQSPGGGKDAAKVAFVAARLAANTLQLVVARHTARTRQLVYTEEEGAQCPKNTKTKSGPPCWGNITDFITGIAP